MPAPVPAPEHEAMTCEQFLARHSDLLDDELPEATAVEMRLHMVGCERCARYDRVLRRGLALFREAEQIQPTTDPYLALQEHISQGEQPGASRRGPAVATLAAAAMLGFFAWSALDRMDEQRAAAPSDPAVQRVSPESLGFWANPIVGADLVAPGLPSTRWPRAIAGGRASQPGAIPVALQPAVLERGPYTPLVLQPPDYGQALDPASLPALTPGGR